MIYYIIGIRRSGLHAIAQWLFPMMGEYIYLNNVEPGKLSDIEMIVKGNFNVIIGLENRTVEEIEEYCTKGKRIWVRRNKEEVIKSQKTWYDGKLTPIRTKQKIRDSLVISDSYAERLTYSDEFIIRYHEWNNDPTYRRIKAAHLGLQFNDINKDKIYPVYGVSSYEKT